jgi:hypothetical protein
MAKQYLLKQYEGIVQEVGTTDERTGQYVLLDLGSHGRVTLRGLTMEEARACGAALYRPAVVRIQIQADVAGEGA